MVGGLVGQLSAVADEVIQTRPVACAGTVGAEMGTTISDASESSKMTDSLLFN